MSPTTSPRLSALPSRKRLSSRSFLLAAVAGLLALSIACTGSPLLADRPSTPPASAPTQAAQERTPAVQTPAREATATSLPSNTPVATATSTPLPTRTPKPAATSTALPFTPTLEAAIPLTATARCVPQDTERALAVVSKVVDGDTIDVVIDGQTYPVRYIGIDAPETSFQQEPLGKEASERNAGLVLGKTVLLVKDQSETDRFDRLLRYVFVGDVFVNDELVRQGYASAVEYPPDTACAQTFQAAQELAQAEGLGRWAVTPTAAISPTAASTASLPGPVDATLPPQDGKNCSPAYPTVCIPPPPPDLDCADIAARRFQVLPPDPHNFDGDHNGIGCERG